MKSKTGSPTYRPLLERLGQIPVVDAHEHLPAEPALLAEPVSALTLYRQYTRLPMLSSGLSPDDFQRIHDPALSVLERWRLLAPFVRKIAHTSFARVARITMERFWDVSEIADDNVEEVSERIAAEHTSGLYRRVLVEACGIRRVLNQDTSVGPGDEFRAYRDQELLCPVVPLIATDPPDNVFVSRLGGEAGFRSLDDYLDWARGRLRALAAGGAKAFKTTALPYRKPDRAGALAELKSCAQGLEVVPTEGDAGPLLSYVHEELLKAAADAGPPLAVHAGFWGDFRRLNPTHMIPVIQRHPEIHFDLFHLGIPYVRETAILAVNFPNVSVNMCWAHSINAAMARSALDELIDQLGVDKVIAFGGDVRWMVHKVYGHLELARRNVAEVLAGRIERGLMDMDEAVRLAETWFRDNPARVYGLGQKEAAG